MGDVRLNRTLIQAIANCIEARANCRDKHGTVTNPEWFERHGDRARWIVENFAPSGSGIDCGTSIDLDASKPDKIVLSFSFHHMDEYGGYDGWTEHKITVRPTFAGIAMSISGRDRNGIKEYLYQTYDWALTGEAKDYVGLAHEAGY